MAASEGRREGGRKEERRWSCTIVFKSRDHHLAGGE